MTSGGYQIPGEGTGDDGFDEDGYDESQRAEILEVTRDGPTDGTILTDLAPDMGDDDEDDDENEDDLLMASDEVGEEDDESATDEDDDDEDDLQEDFEDGQIDDPDVDAELADRDDAALRP